jgi:signal transduction histidine kinase
MNARAGGAAPINDTLRWVVAGFRLFAIVWMGALVGATLATDPGANQLVVGGTYGLALAWTGITVAHALHPRWFHHPAWVILDGTVALWVSVSPFVAGSQDLFFGGYPLSGLLVVAYAGGLGPALIGAAALATGQVVGWLSVGARTATQMAGDIGGFTVAALAFGWGITALRRYDRDRTQALEALEEERAARRQAHDRAEIAAHLHDSVLQTLALLQQAPGDPRQVASLARRQERELRGYIDQIASPFSPSLRAALRHAAGEVEDLFMVRIDTVVVGDCAVDEPLQAVVQASREAMVNAAKHSGVDRAALFAEVTLAGVTVTVRDRGRGFDAAAPGTGRGLAESIVGRMGRCGGTADIRSVPGEGTEIELHLGRGNG